MIDILSLDRDGILALDPNAVDRRLTAEELIHMAKQLDAFWAYNYEAAAAGRLGHHALLKSLLHSDGFFISRILLKPENVRRIMAMQMVMLLKASGLPLPTHVAGIPDGATELGEMVNEILGTKYVKLEKIDGKIVLVDEVPADAILWLIEDFCTRGTGFAETVAAVLESAFYSPKAWVLPVNTVLLNRGGLKDVSVPGHGNFPVMAVVEHRINDWDSAKGCPLCDKGSTAMKPKVDDATWQMFIHSQDEVST